MSAREFLVMLVATSVILILGVLVLAGLLHIAEPVF